MGSSFRAAKQHPDSAAGSRYEDRNEIADTGGIVLAPAKMGPPLKVPCVECPARRDSARGHLGGYSVGMYLEVLHGPASIACHTAPDFDANDVSKQRQCTGVVRYRANVGHVCTFAGRVTGAQDAVDELGPDRENYLATPSEFYHHHNVQPVAKLKG